MSCLIILLVFDYTKLSQLREVHKNTTVVGTVPESAPLISTAAPAGGFSQSQTKSFRYFAMLVCVHRLCEESWMMPFSHLTSCCHSALPRCIVCPCLSVPSKAANSPGVHLALRRQRTAKVGQIRGKKCKAGNNIYASACI